MRWGLILLAIVVAVAAGAVFWPFGGGVPVEAARVAEAPIREYVEEEGKTRLSDSYLLTTPFAGRVEAISLVEGTKVKKGQVVARLVPGDLALNVAAATAAVDRLKASIKESEDVSVESTSLLQALKFVESMDRTVEAATARVQSGEAKRDYAQKNLERIDKLVKDKARSEDDLDRARVAQVESSVEYQQDVLVQRAMEAMQAATSLMPTLVRQYIDRKKLGTEVLEKQLAEAEVLLKQATRDEQRGTIESPVDGVILERLSRDEGQLAAGTALVRIGRSEDIELEADVLSQEVVQIRPENDVEVFGPAIGPIPARAKVTRIYPAGFTKVSSLGVEQQRVKVIMKFELPDQQRLRDTRDLGVEYRVRVRIYTAGKQKANVVPRSALFRGADGNWQVFVVRDGRALLQQVKTGLGNDETVEIKSGLNVGDVVVLAPETNLRNGQAVQLPEKLGK